MLFRSRSCIAPALRGLGQAAGVDHERGANRVSASMLTRIARTLTVPVSEMFGEASPANASAVDEVAALGMPGKRAQTIIALAQFAADGKLRRMPGDTLESCVQRLCSVPGIGNWTAHYVAMRALRFTDAFPDGDLGLQKAVGMLLCKQGQDLAGQRSSAAQCRQIAERWRPWRSYAAMLLWQFGLTEAETANHANASKAN